MIPLTPNMPKFVKDSVGETNLVYNIINDLLNTNDKNIIDIYDDNTVPAFGIKFPNLVGNQINTCISIVVNPGCVHNNTEISDNEYPIMIETLLTTKNTQINTMYERVFFGDDRASDNNNINNLLSYIRTIASGKFDDVNVN